MRLGLEVLLSVGLMLGIILTYYAKKDVIEAFIFSIVGFFGFYVVISGLLFFVEKFTFQRTLIIEIVLQCAVWAGLLLAGKRPAYTVDLKRFIIPCVIILVILPVTITKFDFFGMGQDQGQYQTKAIYLMKGNAINQLDFKAYDSLGTAKEKEAFASSLEELVGLFNYDPKLAGNTEQEKSSVSVVLNCYPTYPAILGLWGMIFGMSQMAGVQTIFLICFIFLAYFIAEKLKLNRALRILVPALAGISPMVIWVSKSSLTEMFLAVIVASFIYSIVGEEETAKAWVSAVPVLFFAFFHVSLYTILPIIVIVLWTMFMMTKNKQYILAQIFSVLSYYAGFLIFRRICATYVTAINYKPVYHLGITQNNILLVVTAACAAAILAGICLWIFGGKLQKVFYKIIYDKKFGILIILSIIFLLAFTVIKGRNDLPHLTIWAYCVATGFIVLPAALVMLIVKLFSDRIHLFTAKNTVICLLFWYCILFHTAFLRRETADYYYYSRYIVPYLLIAILMFAVLFREVKQYKIYLIVGISVLIAVPFDMVLKRQMDDSRMEWDVLEEVTGCITDTNGGQNTAVIVDGGMDFARIIYLPIDAVTKADVFFGNEDLAAQVGELKEKYNQVYVVTNEMYDSTKEDGLNASLIYREKNIQSEDMKTDIGKIVPTSHSFSQNQIAVSVYKADSWKYDYSVQDIYGFKSSGFSERGYSAGAWMESSEAVIECCLDKSNYNLKISQLQPIAYDLLGRNLNLEVYMNDQLVGKQELSLETNGVELSFTIDRNVLVDGKNELRLVCDLWSPSEYGAADQRELGMSFSQAMFEKK